jgi:acetyl-CoA acetyltransferase
VAREAVVVEAVRTAIGKRNGVLSQAHAVDLSADVLTALAARTGIDPAVVDDVIWGCVGQVGDQAGNIGRFAGLAAGWPESVPGTTVNRAYGSSQQATYFALHTLRSVFLGSASHHVAATGTAGRWAGSPRRASRWSPCGGTRAAAGTADARIWLSRRVFVLIR